MPGSEAGELERQVELRGLAKKERVQLANRVNSAPVIGGVGFAFVAFLGWFVSPWLAAAWALVGLVFIVKLLVERSDVAAAIAAPAGEVVVRIDKLTITSPCLRGPLSIERVAVTEIRLEDNPPRRYLPAPKNVLDLGRLCSGSSATVALVAPMRLTPRRLPGLRWMGSPAECIVDVIRLPINGGGKLVNVAQALGWPTGSAARSGRPDADR